MVWTLEQFVKIFLNHKHTGALPDAKRFNPIFEDGTTLTTASDVAHTNVNNNFSTSQSITGGINSTDTSKIATAAGKGLSVGSTAAPTFALNVFDDGNRMGLPDGTSGTKGMIRLSASGGYTTLGIDIGIQASGGSNGWVQTRDIGTGYIDLLLNPLGGDVGIGNTNPASKLHVSGGAITVDGSGAGITISGGCLNSTTCGYTTISAGDASPSVAGKGFVIYNENADLSITNFDDGVDGQKITVVNRGTNNLTLTRTNMVLPGSVNAVLARYYTISLVLYGGVWYATSPVNNNG